ncbi:LCP family protein [Actinosynnema sp. NPDC047251]|uniref:Cell envelope-related transcriptional attenuator n=1 Tax=Saccharothrix espanaensis (strain ATCC 51144 / DSM 44229 / JCM 9112 / NBRC 15066 / NRRL 15764) TaxID=1179773 RepID=K0JTI3_SACES|nr:LCP family protein [Saccharothrix espanaensis]CCH29236.1 Cell envelope-related transcriptional attenuator [Saccharothrix espanaensis DSM 44229]
MSAGYHQGYQQRGYRPAPKRRKPRVGRIIAAILVLLLAFAVGMWVYVDSSLRRIDALPDYEGRPADTPGTNWLLVGSDARDDLTEEQKADLSTGDAGGRRTDTIMILHIPSGSGKSTLVSVPRDSYVDIPGNGKNKINAAFAFGGPSLLAQTVEGATGLRIDHYMEIGFGGFAGIVDAVGGVDLCIKEPMNDPLAGLDLQPGCQELNGAQALGFVRTRAFATADLQRVQNQREFLSALSDKATSVGTLINPFKAFPLLFASTDSISVNEGDHLHHLAGMAFGMGGGVDNVTVPVGGTPTVPGAGSVVQWDRTNALRLFGALEKDEPVPSDLLQQPG